MRITDLLRRKGTDVVTLSPDATIADAVALLRDRGIGCIVIVGSDSPIVGLVSERDIARSVGTASPDSPVSGIMTADVVTCTPDTDVEVLAALMTDQRVRHIPVVQDGVMRGLVSIGDVVKAHVDELRAERDQLVAYVQS
ncbi:CBS domain-containing protein [Raineyella antarctica]|uniref:CBS domain-containing protein n=1 Tax=Raineyella antarctica TaxID=1577474 RepID=A0A1G6GDM1_9ACTN|nr:CBS domain-containing protein [Raineyella antarctica]SDB80091.1 CBS domain-containing protein [Raineyella antarctica]